ncbi:TetR/AcrR family transcriptional regulator [Phenylobacterium sp.]|uniref:TetR/AcrR family transcriptional regulator n=1 Tax=Phenylobacterium sp. TaxID=1871053 RepID=UPI00301E60A3
MVMTSAPGLTPGSEGIPADHSDGRRRRGQDNRAKIVRAMMEIVHSGEVAPSAEQVASRAEVGLRTVFRHFQDMDSLYREISAVIAKEVRGDFLGPLAAQDWQGRVLEMAGRRIRAYEKMAPFKRAGDAFRHRSKFLGTDYNSLVVELRERLEAELPAPVRRDRDTLEALDLALSFETWSRLRREQGLTPKRTQAVVEAVVRRLLA